MEASKCCGCIVCLPSFNLACMQGSFNRNIAANCIRHWILFAIFQQLFLCTQQYGVCSTHPPPTPWAVLSVFRKPLFTFCIMLNHIELWMPRLIVLCCWWYHYCPFPSRPHGQVLFSWQHAELIIFLSHPALCFH